MKEQPNRQPIDAGIMARALTAIGAGAVAGAKGLVTGAREAWFGPMQPLPAVVQENQRESVVGRQFDYPVGFNTRTSPRGEEAITFTQMRMLGDTYDLLRLVIETRKDQLSKLKWSIKPKDEKKKPDDRCKKAEEFFLFPDKEHEWHRWLRMVVEDMLVLDAPTLYVRKTLGGELYGLEQIDGATIKRVLDPTGRTPIAPQPAYQQILKGVPAVNYTRDELIYYPRNTRVHKVYGYSPVEQIIMTVNIALRRQLHQLQYYTEGNVPEALIGVPENWTPPQIKQFQEYWDSMLEGNTAARRHAKFVPGSIAKGAVFTKEAALKDEYDEWLARVVCFAFSVSPQPFIKEMNRATAQTSQDQSKQEGLAPVQTWVKGLCDFVIMRHMGFLDLEFAWEDEDSTSPKERAEIDKIYVDGKVLHPDEVRADLGRDPLTPEQKLDLNPPVPDELGGDVGGEGKAPPKKPGDNKQIGKALKKKY